MSESEAAFSLQEVVELEVLDQRMSVLKLAEMPTQFPQEGLLFVARTDVEVSVVCETEKAFGEVAAREDGWRALRVRGPLDFAIVGIMAKISSALADADVPLFAVSTFDTDYVLVKEADLDTALDALRDAGCRVAPAAA